MKARLVRIGNSRGVRLPKPLIEQAGLGEEVELTVQDGALVIRNAAHPRAGWAEAARTAQGAGALLDPADATRFDAEEWHW
jgi:antitoxin MazE